MISRMPVLFLGHGSPMNAIEEYGFTDRLHELGRSLPRPKAVLCVSAHWLTSGSWVTAMERPRTIHDFYGFPKALFDVQYPAPGAPEVAELVRKEVKTPAIQSDANEWGLDHGTWSVLRHVFPDADVPVLQLSIDIEKPPRFHYELGRELRILREKGVLIVGSGNIVHNLGRIDWDRSAKPHDWAVEFDAWIKDGLDRGDHSALVDRYGDSEAGRLSVPTPDHYYPFLYVLGAAGNDETPRHEWEELQNASISMRCVSFGRS
jgi:4,5-DOPA dioxygenase extradiol